MYKYSTVPIKGIIIVHSAAQSQHIDTSSSLETACTSMYRPVLIELVQEKAQLASCMLVLLQ